MNLAIYIHWPFCKAKCPYCDFNSHVSSNINDEEWLKAYLLELNYFANYIKQHNISSIFFGGGTPTLMAPKIVSGIINYLQSLSSFTADIEITLEGNPTSVEAQKLSEFKAAGINRLSLGVQSLVAEDLQFLGREHSADEAIKAIATASKIFTNYSFDLIYARPNQSLKSWQEELSKAIKMAGNHLSLYQLTIEKGTRFFSDYSKGAFKIPDEDLAADFYLLTQEITDKAGLNAYEISNHARPGFASRHNLSYWRYNDYLGIGPGAHSRISINGQKHALMMISQPENWLKAVSANQQGIQINQALDKQTIIEEIIMMGLRINEGVNHQNFQNITGKKITEAINSKALDKIIANQFMTNDAKTLRCTKQGMLLVNYITSQLLS